jgi:uncharacterized protein YbjQ (UPF0145 family)
MRAAQRAAGKASGAMHNGPIQIASSEDHHVDTQFPVTTAFDFPNWTIDRSLGPVFGLVVRSMGFAKGIGAGFKALAGGEVHQYTELLEDSRRHALDRMIENAKVMGANGILAFRFDSSEIGQQLTELVAYGTAVIVKANG